MPLTLNGVKYYRTAEACATAGISRATFLRWVREGIFGDVEHRDRRGWRLFNEDDVDRLRAEASRVQKKQISSRSSKKEGSSASQLRIRLHRL